MKRWIFLLSLGVAGALLCRLFLFEGIVVASPSMEPALPTGANFFMDKFTILLRAPGRGEIVVFPSPLRNGKDLIKRVIGLPGETIMLKDKLVYINGQPLNEPYVRYKRKDEILQGDNIPAMKIPEDSYFVLGDNRDESEDSTSWKDPKTGMPIYFIRRDEIKGRLMGVEE